jgi:enterochelin esterase-like enzyme
MSLSRRHLLVGVGALVAAGGAAAVLDPVDRTRVLEGAQGSWDSRLHKPTLAQGVRLIEGVLQSAARNREVGYTIAVPRAASGPLPLVVLLHGRGGTHRSAFRGLDMDGALTEAMRTDGRPLALVSVDGGSHTYFHRRADGDDPARMIRAELIPAVGRQVSLNGRFGLMGWSMGGYGALLIAADAGPTVFPAVAACSAALWRRWEDSAPGAFDGAQDFAAHDVLRSAPTRLAQTAVRLVCGKSDPFIATNRALARELPRAESDFPQGSHTNVFWRRHNAEQLRFLTKQLS